MAKIANEIISVLLLLVLSNISLANNIQSPINNKYINFLHNDNYSFLIAGHLYGASENQSSVFPSASFLGMLNEINNFDCSFFVSLGDNFRSTNDVHIINYKNSVANQLSFPIFNAVGNHDVTDRQKYSDNFGNTYYDFVYDSELYIFLDSELNQSRISGDQLNYFINVIKHKAMNLNIKNVFIFSHKLIWAVNISTYKIVFDHVNFRGGYKYDKNFYDIILPVLNDLAKDKNIFWISGDIGCSWSLPLFYDKDNNTGITFIATGIGDTERDLILKVNIKNGVVTFLPISLGIEEVKNIEHYGLQYWTSYFYREEHKNKFPINYCLKIRRMLLHKYYWMGVFTILVIVLLIYYIKKRRNF